MGELHEAFVGGFMSVNGLTGDFHEAFVRESCRTGHKRIRRDPLMNLPDHEPTVLWILPYFCSAP